METSDSVLEQFRQQWKAEVSARSDKKKSRHRGRDSHENVDQQVSARKWTASAIPLPAHPSQHLSRHNPRPSDGTVLAPQNEVLSRATSQTENLHLSCPDDDGFTKAPVKEPESALEHYERAVEKETQGNLGVSLSHYRRAYRLDASVDQSYKLKYFPQISRPDGAVPTDPPIMAQASVRDSPEDSEKAASTIDLVQSYMGLPILGEPAAIKGDKPPPCPFATLPSELVLQILLEMAVQDPALFVRMALVCKRLAFHVFTESRIWKRIALGKEFGLASNVYNFKVDVQGREIIHQSLDATEDKSGTSGLLLNRGSGQREEEWREIFRIHPRIRFNGVYISTVNYTRAGGASASHATWGTPVHIVTYYRYLRFFRDGTVISLLSTSEPIDVVHNLTKENMAASRNSKAYHPANLNSTIGTFSNGSAAAGAPPSVYQIMKHALHGRWYLATSQVILDNNRSQKPIWAGNVHLETEGPGPRYLYTMQLSLTSSSRSQQAVKNNKLQWKGFWSYNLLTHDWSTFQLKNDKPFLFSRVRSYGLGG